MWPASRAEAKAAGASHYFTGRPCKSGHVCERRVDSKNCVQCKRDRDNRRAARPERRASRVEYDRRRYIEAPGYFERKNRAYYAAKADAMNAKKRAYWAANRDRMAEAARAWRARNRHVIRELCARRKKAVKRAIPAWANMAAVREVYREAVRLTRETGVLHHVDHIVPLQGRHVCGLHVENNLRAIPWRENVAKKNRYDPS